MNYKVYAIGNKVEKFYSDAIKEYQKRLSKFCNITFSSYKNSQKLPFQDTDKYYKIVISPAGKSLSSEELAEKIKEFELTGITDILMIIGNEKIHCNETISISSMKMSLGLTSTIFFEQLYRAYKILNNEPYHK
ncbi:23S rRNA (pseudouridine(1915)-N(3))-methyltransferase RlmH [Thermoanaerobacter sp. CM-CNRG TB177]|jgi:23S rRNA (pseudouridine1915-N3)-methyltransferase|uniref:23S rRNA (pseudouridine(1915)-N(3))-methyltransferase RlmH n=1 Tax=Thermoanaerobacter sp. CM-CNRG TB177 TaxID=2800659 RepID=UPI001BDEF8FB|nr:23S rRNA (pseudouridine(1915)-N(3))-methyltransferase RlmH [Thermoanaerobacter sp. CM-CNRG TB177]MBT1279323.1 23S rRNA (pseudouridine(1915)-N(3))-methyltransferase RlmH [Thermoanaerobacter sp. CM-CNRG TB177]